MSINENMNGPIDRWMGHMNEWTREWMNGRLNEQMEWMNEWCMCPNHVSVPGNKLSCLNSDSRGVMKEGGTVQFQFETKGEMNFCSWDSIIIYK